MSFGSIQARPADILAATSWLSWLSAKLIEATPLLQAISFIVAILAGLFAIYHHWTHRATRYKGPHNRRAADREP